MIVNHRQAGFTLVELVIAIAILAILIGIAIPSYTEYVIRTNRAEARISLQNAAQALERCYTRYSAYTHADCTVATTLQGAGFLSENDHYLVESTAIAAATYSLTATPQGGQATRDSKCDVFTLTQTGQRGMTGTHSWTSDRCWGQ